MPIRKYLSEVTNTFEPEAIAVMSAAFEQACAALHVFAGDEHGRSVVATRIVDLARLGVLDAKALCDRVVSESRVVA